ncbi:hypothetical protein F511_37051 [Dorcoceras hygrometricum]|uniref:Uncharacterized protein n=1 Tax=Dorcoceras hygrometricum TaxID=472368 RepID=A0A2Z7BT33_9LAMI|nr:hypothetical protein F511_37051 [Dorcoceras hygrometricum]
MFKTLEDTWLKGFLSESGSVYESVVVEFFANAKVIARTVVNFVANRKLALTKEAFAEALGLPTEGMKSFQDIPNQTVVEMALCAMSGSFDMVSSEKFNLIVAITASPWIVRELLRDMIRFECVGGYGEQPYPSVTGFRRPTKCIIGALGQGRPWGVSQAPSIKSVNQQIGADLYQEKSECWTSWDEWEAGEKKKAEKAAVEKPIRKSEGDAANIDLPQITWSQAHKLLLPGENTAQSAHPKVLALEFSTQAEQEQATLKQQAQQEEQIEEIDQTVENVEDTETEKEQLSSVDGQ